MKTAIHSTNLFFSTLPCDFLFYISLYLSLSLNFSCWLSLEGGLLYAFVGPAAVIVLVSFRLCFPIG